MPSGSTQDNQVNCLHATALFCGDSRESETAYYYYGKLLLMVQAHFRSSSFIAKVPVSCQF